MVAPGAGKLGKGTSLPPGHAEGRSRRDAVVFGSYPGAVGLQLWVLSHSWYHLTFPSHGHLSLHLRSGDGTSLGMRRGRAAVDAVG